MGSIMRGIDGVVAFPECTAKITRWAVSLSRNMPDVSGFGDSGASKWCEGKAAYYVSLSGEVRGTANVKLSGTCAVFCGYTSGTARYAGAVWIQQANHTADYKTGNTRIQIMGPFEGNPTTS